MKQKSKKVTFSKVGKNTFFWHRLHPVVVKWSQLCCQMCKCGGSAWRYLGSEMLCNGPVAARWWKIQWNLCSDTSGVPISGEDNGKVMKEATSRHVAIVDWGEKKPEYDHLTVAHWTQIYEDARMFMLGNKGSVSVLFSSNYDVSGERQHLAVSVSL